MLRIPSWDETVNEVKGFVQNPDRVGIAYLTGGSSEVFRGLYGEVSRRIEDEIEKADLEKSKTPSPSENTPEVKAARGEAEAKYRQGRASTILTRPQGLASTTVNLSRRTLLGA